MIVGTTRLLSYWIPWGNRGLRAAQVSNTLSFPGRIQYSPAFLFINSEISIKPYLKLFKSLESSWAKPPGENLISVKTSIRLSGNLETKSLTGTKICVDAPVLFKEFLFPDYFSNLQDCILVT